MASIKFTISNKPVSITLKAKLAWIHLLRERKVFIRTKNGHWLVADADTDVNNGTAYSNDNDFICWLESVTQELMDKDKVVFLQEFCPDVPELITDAVATVMENEINA